MASPDINNEPHGHDCLTLKDLDWHTIKELAGDIWSELCAVFQDDPAGEITSAAAPIPITEPIKPTIPSDPSDVIQQIV